MEIKLVKSGKDLKDFIKLPWKIYKNDRFWVPPLISEVKFVLNQHKNPFWKHAQGEYFIAKKEGKVVGRIAALIDHLHVNHRKEKCGFFGFFESTNDYDVAELLLSTAKMYLKENGMEIMRGPMNPSINEECGTLIDGFDYPPFLLMTHNPPYYKELLERFGLLKAVDWYAYLGPIPSQLPKEIEIASQFAKSKNSNFVVRPIDLQNLAVEAEKVREMTAADLEARVKELRMELMKLRFQKATNQLKNPLKKRELRKDIARALTIIKEKQNEGQRTAKS